MGVNDVFNNAGKPDTFWPSRKTLRDKSRQVTSSDNAARQSHAMRDVRHLKEACPLFPWQTKFIFTPNIFTSLDMKKF